MRSEKAAPDPRQPRGLTGWQHKTEDIYRAGMHAELQKFGRTDEEARQLRLFSDKTESEAVEPFGLDLSIPEDKALSALQILASRIQYDGQEMDSEAFRGSVNVVRLSFTWSEYFEAYGLAQRGGRYQGKDVQDAREALLSGLTKSRTIGFELKKWTGAGKKREQKVDMVRTRQPLVRIYEHYTGLDLAEAERLKAGEDMPERINRLMVELSPLLSIMIETFYLLKPVGLHREIEEATGGRRVSRSVSLFIQWLLTKDQMTIQIRQDKLAVKLRLDSYIRQRKPRILEQRISECLKTAKTLGYLLAYQQDSSGLLKLSLNPTRCQRIGGRKQEV